MNARDKGHIRRMQAKNNAHPQPQPINVSLKVVIGTNKPQFIEEYRKVGPEYGSHQATKQIPADQRGEWSMYFEACRRMEATLRTFLQAGFRPVAGNFLFDEEGNRYHIGLISYRHLKDWGVSVEYTLYGEN